MSTRGRLLSLIATGLVCIAAAPTSAAFASPFLGQLSTVTKIGSTVPATNGDLNPYGITTVTRSEGSLVAGDTLVSNFNNKENLQGTGSTIVQVSPSGETSVFAEIKASSLPGPCPGGVGLTTALTVLPSGFVIVGSTPSTNGKASTSAEGCLIVLNSSGEPVKTIAGQPINGPWDLTESNFFMGLVNVVYVSNVLNGTAAAGGATVNGGTIVRLVLLSLPGLPPRVVMTNVIAEGFPERTSESAFVEGPTGLAVTGRSMMNQTLYAVDTVQNRIAEVPNALLRMSPSTGGGTTVAEGGEINDPLGMVTAPQGHNLLVASAGNERILEVNPSEGTLQANVNTGIGPGGLFGLTLNAKQNGISFVNDNENALDLLH